MGSKVLGYLKTIGIGALVGHMAEEDVTDPTLILNMLAQIADDEATRKDGEAKIAAESTLTVEREAPNAGHFERERAVKLRKFALSLRDSAGKI